MGHCLVSPAVFRDLGLELTCSLSQEKIKEMECELLVSSFKNPKTIALVKESIENSSDGSSSHRAGALKLGLRMAFELKKQTRQPPAPLSYSGWYNPVPYSSVRANTFCPSCSRDYMQYAGYGYERTRVCTSCQGYGGEPHMDRFIQPYYESNINDMYW